MNVFNVKGHEASYVSSGLVDHYECSCGWRSSPYFDGAEYAYKDWLRHAEGSVMRSMESEKMFTDEQIERYKRHVGNGGWIAVDLDGTWAMYHGWTAVTNFGAPIDLMTERVRAWIDMGLEVRVMTARYVPGGYDGVSDEEFQKAIGDWTERVCGTRLRATCTKDFKMLEQWDDRAVQVVPNTGRTLAEEHEAELSAMRGAP